MTFIIAEMSANHGGSIDKAQEMIMAAKWAGCDAVKFQLYRKEDLPNTYDPALHVEMGPMIWWIGEFCARNNIALVVSIFSWWAIEYLSGLPLLALKLASPQSTRLPYSTYYRLARRIKEVGRLWVSSGPEDWDFMKSLNEEAMFFCPPGHPATLKESDLRMMDGRFRMVLFRGFSDHTVGIIQTLAAVKAGATHIEKHFMLDDNCVDAEFSINPDQMKMLCDLAR